MAFVLWSGIALLVIAVAVQVRRIARLRAEVRERDERLAAVSHELRGPLQPITLAVSRLRRDGDLTPKQRDAVDRAPGLFFGTLARWTTRSFEGR